MSSEPQRQGVWDEELMCDVMPEPRPSRGVRARAGALRNELSARNVLRAQGAAHELTQGRVPAVIYAPDGATHANFIDPAYRRIVADPAWARRLTKVHTSRRQARPTGADEQIRTWRELDTASSSDALLMNVFCYPGMPGLRLRALLGIEPGTRPEFGHRPGVPLARGLRDRTEFDLRLGDLLVEAKLTESDFQQAPLRLVERYVSFDEVFDRERLDLSAGIVRSYQLVRAVMVASATAHRFCVLCDARRPDLLEAWFRVMQAVRSAELQASLRMVTWQEVAQTLPAKLQVFLAGKYGIG